MKFTPKNFVNYHSHKSWSQAVVGADCPLGYEDYIKRAKELGQSVITSVEHGFQGNYWLLNEMILQENIELRKRRLRGEENVPRDLKFVFGAEVYWVKNRHEKDRSNCHMIVLAKNENGRQAINYMLSIANEDGIFNKRPRVDFELIDELPSDDVFITTACVGYWNKYEDIEEITLRFYKKFKNNFMLEVQCHHTEKQVALNKKILEMHKKYGIDIICGLDTHVINTESPYSDNDIKRRDKILEYKHIEYPDEDGWFIDYPDVNTIVKRFREQGVLSDSEIKRSIVNTSLIEEFDDLKLGGMEIVQDGDNFYLDAPIKMPTLYPDLTMDERNKMFKDIINKEWKKYAKAEHIKKEDFPKYIEGIKYEVGEIIKCKMSDYFLLHYKPMKRGVEVYGGKITKRGRGSGVSYFINTLLGFSKVDRFKTPIKLYPERFITSDRILKAKALPDLDNNVDRQEPFVKAFRDELGEHSIYPMISFKPLQKSSAIKLYMGAEGINAQIQNEVTAGLKEYEKALKHCESEEDKEQIDIKEYIDPKYHKYVELSKPYQGIIMTKSVHACAHLIISGDIRREIGLFKCISESNGKETMTACIEGSSADHYKYLKTDLLIVDVVGLTEAIWERIGEPSPSNNKLEEMLKSEKGQKAWEMYAKGLTLCVNQCEQTGTRNKCKRYKMQNTAELSAFVAGVRPAFKSLLNDFLDRKPYTTGVPKLDELLEDSYHYMLYQESIMAYLSFLGIDMKETYDIIKKISKKVYLKHPELMEELKNKCRPMWIKKVGDINGFEETWQIMNDAGSYAFNASHSYCVGGDGAEIAYCKGNYPFETYEVCLNWFYRKGNKDKVSLLQQEMMDGFGIKVGEMKWGKDNRKFTLDKENNCIYPCLSSIKGMGRTCAEELYDLYENNEYQSFFELVLDIKSKTTLDNSMLEDLIKLDYFSEFGKSQKLLKIVELYNVFYKKEKGEVKAKKIFKKEKLPLNMPIDEFRKYANKETEKQFSDVNINKLIKDIEARIEDKDVTLILKLKTQKECLGYLSYINPELRDYGYVLEVNDKYTPKIKIYRIDTGEILTYKISRRIYKGLNEDDLIYIYGTEEKRGSKKVGEKLDPKTGKMKPTFEKDPNKVEKWVSQYELVNTRLLK